MLQVHTVENGGGGACLFMAFSQFLENTQTIILMRRLICQYMRNNHQWLKDATHAIQNETTGEWYMNHPNPTRNDRLSIEAYIREMEKPDTYGTIEIDACADAQLRRVHLHLLWPDDRPGTGAVKNTSPCTRATRRR